LISQSRGLGDVYKRQTQSWDASGYFGRFGGIPAKLSRCIEG
jgi:hypothetical protein